jgi:hypothetical protein
VAMQHVAADAPGIAHAACQGRAGHACRRWACRPPRAVHRRAHLHLVVQVFLELARHEGARGVSPDEAAVAAVACGPRVGCAVTDEGLLGSGGPAGARVHSGSLQRSTPLTSVVPPALCHVEHLQRCKAVAAACSCWDCERRCQRHTGCPASWSTCSGASCRHDGNNAVSTSPRIARYKGWPPFPLNFDSCSGVKVTCTAASAGRSTSDRNGCAGGKIRRDLPAYCGGAFASTWRRQLLPQRPRPSALGGTTANLAFLPTALRSCSPEALSLARHRTGL